VIDQVGDVHQAVNHQVGQLHEQAEVGDARHDALELFANLVFHELALEPGLDFTSGIFRPALVRGTDGAKALHFAARVVVTACLAPPQDVADSPVHQQVRVTPDRRGEVRVGV